MTPFFMTGTESRGPFISIRGVSMVFRNPYEIMLVYVANEPVRLLFFNLTGPFIKHATPSWQYKQTTFTSNIATRTNDGLFRAHLMTD